VLVVDDEPLVREVAAASLRAHGYEVRTCADGESAVAELRDRVPTVVLLDLTMPGMGGVEAMRMMREAAPGVRVVLTSGLPPEGEAGRMLEERGVAFLAKPYDMGELARAVSRACDGVEGQEAR
jgi:CheY-like chemotaxis protein